MRFDPRQLFAFQQRLSPRERAMVGATLGIALVLGLYTLVWEPLVERRAAVVRQIQAKQQELAAIQQMRTAYMDLLRQFEAGQRVLARPAADFSLFPYMEATVAQVVGRDRITSMNPEEKVVADTYKEDAVELRLTNLKLEQLVDLMYRIEKTGDNPLRVTRLQIKKRPRDPYAFDVSATVSMLRVVQP